MTSIAAGSYPTGSGQTLLNLVASPADGSSQTDYDFWLGGDGTTNNDPTYTVVDGRAGLSDSYVKAKNSTDFIRQIGYYESPYTFAAFYRTSTYSNQDSNAPIFTAGSDGSVGQSCVRLYSGLDNIGADGRYCRLFLDTTNTLVLDFNSLEPIEENTNQGLILSATNGGRGFIIRNGLVQQFCADKRSLSWANTNNQTPRFEVFGKEHDNQRGKGTLHRFEAYNEALTFTNCRALYNAHQTRFSLPAIPATVDTDSDSANVRILLDLDGDALDRSGSNNHFSEFGSPFNNTYGVGTMDGLNNESTYYQKSGVNDYLELPSTTLCNVEDFTLDFDMLYESSTFSDDYIFSTASYSIRVDYVRLLWHGQQLVAYNTNFKQDYWNRIRIQRVGTRVCVWVNNYLEYDNTIATASIGAASVVRIGGEYNGSTALRGNVLGLKNMRFTLGTRTSMGATYAQQSVLTPYPTP